MIRTLAEHARDALVTGDFEAARLAMATIERLRVQAPTEQATGGKVVDLARRKRHGR